MYRKKILINHLSAPRNKITGITNYLFYLLDELLKNNNFDYILLSCWGEEELPSMLKNRGLQVLTEKEIQSQPLALLRQHLLIPKLIKKYKIDLEFVPSPSGTLFSTHPRIIVVHDLYMKVLKEHYKAMHRLWWNLFFPLRAQTAKHIVCVSENTEKDLNHYYPYTKGKSSAIYNGPCLRADGENVIENKANYGVFVANVTPNKGAKTLIEAMSILEQKGVSTEIWHIGGDSKSRLKKYADQFGLKKPPVSKGVVTNEELEEIYSNAKYLAFPSEYEGFGMPVVEAQSFGAVPVVSDIPVLREVAGSGACFFELNNAKDMAEKIENILNDDIFKSKSACGIQNSKKFTWSRSARQTENIFRKQLKV